MDQHKLDRILKYFREEMMVANAAGTQGGFGSNSAAKGPTAGFDPVAGKMQKRKRPQIIGKGKFPGLRKRWSGKGES